MSRRGFVSGQIESFEGRDGARFDAVALTVHREDHPPVTEILVGPRGSALDEAFARAHARMEEMS